MILLPIVHEVNSRSPASQSRRGRRDLERIRAGVENFKDFFTPRRIRPAGVFYDSRRTDLGDKRPTEIQIQ